MINEIREVLFDFLTVIQLFDYYLAIKKGGISVGHFAEIQS